MSPEFYALRSSRSSLMLPHSSELGDSLPLLMKKKGSPKDSHSACKTFVFVLGFVSLSAVAITLAFVYGMKTDEEITGLGAIVSSGPGCAGHGGEILRKGGSAIDAAIVSLLCDGIILPHSLGLGGGFVATIYTKRTGKVETLIARETAPSAATEDMYVGKGDITGAIAAAIPSEIYGYWRLHEKYGKLPWKDLFTNAIDLCKNGHSVNKHLANNLALYEERILRESSMAEIFVNPQTKKIYKEGETMYRPKLAETLEIIAVEGINSLYRGGSLGRALALDIQELGGIITEKDLQNYEVRWEDPIVAHFTGGYKLYTTPLPTSGILLGFILNVMDKMYTNRLDVYWARLVETFKHAYGHRTHLGDMHFEPSVVKVVEQLLSDEFIAQTQKLIKDDTTVNDLNFYGANYSNIEDHGTANMIILEPNGDAIAITSTVNSHFGAKVRSRRTGIILNDEMDDFSTPGKLNFYGIPASPTNYIKPGKRPLSSMCPSMVFDKNGHLQMMIGGAGGSRITTAVAQVILRYLILDESIGDSLAAGRIHHQLAPMRVDVEPDVPEHTNEYLLGVGHEINYLATGKAYSALTAIGLKTSQGHVYPQPAADLRRPGSAVVVKL